jgi:hypothetical protein
VKIEFHYEVIARAIRDAGFYTNAAEDHGTWHRACICSKRRPDGGLTGNCFWISRLDGSWYLGTWSGSIYRLCDETRLAELCIGWLTRVPDGTRVDFDEQLKAEFELVHVSETAFNRAAGIA